MAGQLPASLDRERGLALHGRVPGLGKDELVLTLLEAERKGLLLTVLQLASITYLPKTMLAS